MALGRKAGGAHITEDVSRRLTPTHLPFGYLNCGCPLQLLYVSLDSQYDEMLSFAPDPSWYQVLPARLLYSQPPPPPIHE
jgi:hypothetical protein